VAAAHNQIDSYDPLTRDTTVNPGAAVLRPKLGKPGFITHAQRGCSATNIRNISRKDAKAAKENVSELGVLGALARVNLRVR
jgi:hypothetical protein